MIQQGNGISRRTLLGSALTAAAAAASATALAARKRKPNFLFILADDLGAFDLSCYGRPDFMTPHIDSLAATGVRFNFGYANSSTCAPTRTALISGCYPNRFMVGSGFGGEYPSDTIGYPASLPSLPSILKQAGYRTGLIGKWDLGHLPTFSPNKSRYDEFFGFMGGAISYWTHDLTDFGDPTQRTPDFYDNEKPVEAEGYVTDLFSDRACDYIRRNSANPFLLSLHYSAPHWPWETRTDKGQPRLTDAHFSGGSPDIYRQMVQAMDDGVGRVLRTLQELDLCRDTIVVFTSDNGGERFSKMWPLRGEKGDLWEGGTRVPLLISWPGKITGGSQSNQVAITMDFLPTFASLAGTQTDPRLPPDGVDLSPQLFGTAPSERTIFWKTPGNMLSALAYPWKYLRLGEREFLYNLEEDVTEHANYRLRNPQMFARLKAESENWSNQMQQTLPAVPKGLLESMEALDSP